jgi:drug/metabolite transporter (DMT)-like permease
MLVALTPILFVLLWSTGFLGAKFGLPHAEPLTFLLIRFALVCAILLPIAMLTGARWPQTRSAVLHIAIAGLLIHATYLGGVFIAIHRGLPAGTAALITGLQPLLTGLVAAPYLGERISRRQWLGLLLGFGGVFMVVADKASLAEANLGNVLPAFVAVSRCSASPSAPSIRSVTAAAWTCAPVRSSSSPPPGWSWRCSHRCSRPCRWRGPASSCSRSAG